MPAFPDRRAQRRDERTAGFEVIALPRNRVAHGAVVGVWSSLAVAGRTWVRGQGFKLTGSSEIMHWHVFPAR
jgi:hypothetical protein